MALTTEQFQAWLEDPTAIRCILVETVANIGGTETQIYLSNHNYVTKANESPANTAYLPIVKTSIKFSESLAVGGTGSSISFGDLSIDNTDGSYDIGLQAAWQGRPINIYVGDPRFPRDDFTLILSGIVYDVSSSSKNSISLQIRDKLEKLNTPITEEYLGNYWKGNIVSTDVFDNPNKEQVKPLIFGEVFNITPVLIDPSTLEYMVHNGPIESIIEVRDNGVPLVPSTGYTVNLTKGTFELLRNPAGTITCSVQGDKNPTYNNTTANIIKHILKNYGNPSVMGAITDSDIDLTNFSAFQAAHPHVVGIYISNKDNMIAVCQELAGSVGAELVVSRTGKFKLLKVDVPSQSSISISDEDIIQNTMSISQKPEITTTVKLGYCKNWTVQDKLLTGIPAAHKDLFSGDWLSKTYTNEAAKTLYRQNKLPEQKNTLLLSDASGQVTAEATRLVNLYGTQRYIYKFTTTIKYLQYAVVGNMLNITHSRFGLQNGAYSQIVSTEIDWDTGDVVMEVLV